MPPKKTAADAPAPSSSDVPQKEKKTDGDGARKVAAHPSTAIMVREALQALDSRKGVSSQAVQTYIKQKYPLVDVVRLKHLVRKALKKGIETGTLVRPVKSTVTTGALGKFRLAQKVKEPKSKTENSDPNVDKEPEETKDGTTKPKKAGVTKKKKTVAAKEETEAKSEEESKPPKKSKKEKDATSKDAPAKKPAKKPKSKTTENEDDKGVSAPAKPKATKEAKSGAASQSKTVKAASKAASKAPASKATGRKKTAA